MAKTKKQKSIEETLWDSANKLRSTVEPSEYKHVVLGLIFLKFASISLRNAEKNLLPMSKKVSGNGGILHHEKCILSAGGFAMELFN